MSEGEINRQGRRLGKRDDESVDGIKYADEVERDRCQKVTSPDSVSPGRTVLSLCSTPHTNCMS